MFGFLKQKFKFKKIYKNQTLESNLEFEACNLNQNSTKPLEANSNAGVIDVAVDLEGIIAELRNENNDLALEAAELRLNLDSWLQKAKALEDELQNKNSQFEARVALLQNDLTEANNEKSLILSEFLINQEYLTEMILSFNGLKKSESDLKASLDRVGLDLGYKEKLIKQAEETIAQFELENAQLEIFRDELTANLHLAKDEINQKAKTLWEISYKLKELEGNANSQKNIIGDCESEIAILIEGMHRSQAALIDLYNENNLKESKIQKLNQKIDLLISLYGSKNRYLSSLIRLEIKEYCTYMQWTLYDILADPTDEIDQCSYSLVYGEGVLGIKAGGVNQEDLGSYFFPSLVKKANQPSQRDKFIGFSSADWDLLANFFSSLNAFIDSQKKPNCEVEFDFGFWGGIFKSTIADFFSLPKIFRFDNLRLKRELIHIDYEHLWLEIFDVQFESYRIDRLELRISFSELAAGLDFPKLEIPLVDGIKKPFISWFRESSDEWGGKFELRFCVSKAAMDVGVFSKLEKMDQLFVASTINLLPKFLTVLKDSRTAISRPWEDWITAAKGMGLILGSILSAPKQVAPYINADSLNKKAIEKKVAPRKAVQVITIKADTGLISSKSSRAKTKVKKVSNGKA